MIRDYPDSNISMASLSPALNPTHTNSPGPSHLSLDSNGSTPYTPRRRGHPPIPDHNADSNDPSLPAIPKVTSSSTGGITSRTLPEGYKAGSTSTPTKTGTGSGSVLGLEGGVNVTPIEGKMASSAAEFGGASMALQRSVRALDGVERIGRLLTLDLKGNEIKVSLLTISRRLEKWK
jgi:protein phosphatase 1 regulatory subunit 37